VLGGDLRGHVALEPLAALTHLYALGPLEGARGEVSIFGSEPSIARIEGDVVATASTWTVRALLPGLGAGAPVVGAHAAVPAHRSRRDRA
jgi:hypothetical protein